MPPLIDNNEYRLTLSGTNTENGDYWEQIYHYLLTGTTAAHDEFENAVELCEAFDSIRMPAWIDLVPDNVVCSALSAKRIGGTGGPTATKLVTRLGTKTSCETIGNGPQITWFAGENPMLIGRTYFPGIPNDSLDAGVWDAAFVADAEAFITAMITGLPLFAATVDAIFDIQSVQIGIGAKQVKHGLLRAVPGTQRRRLRR